jgi:beta-galactosidase
MRNWRRLHIALVVLMTGLQIVAGSASAQAAEIPAVARQIRRINDAWSYLEDPGDNLQRIRVRARDWVPVTIPHSWNAFDAVDPVPGYRRSASWYKRKLEVPPNLGERRFRIYFEGVNISCRIYLNDREAGSHVGGYLGFELDLTPFVDLAGENWLYVRVDNSYNPDVIPSQKSDFFIYGGITRDVWTTIVPPQYIERLHIRTSAVSEKSALTDVSMSVMNTPGGAFPAHIELAITDPSGRRILSRDTAVVLRPGRSDFSLTMPALKNPQLWSPDQPSLYTARVNLKTPSSDGDVVLERFGYRWFEFKERGPFYLNGKRLLLRGTHRHEDFAGMANALPDSLHRRDMQMIKEMGANFVRLAHYPQDPEVYRACDELGLLVWDELPWCRGGVGGAGWKSNVRRLLADQIDQNFNHPSIILWSLGNEIIYDLDFPGADNVDSLRSFFGELRALVTAKDPGRPTSVRKFYEAADLVDVFSPSIWMGWYSGQYNNYEKAITEARAQYPRLLHVEYGGDSHVGRHTENPLGGDGYTTPDGWEKKFERTRLTKVALQGDWSESYIVDLFDWHLHVSERLDWFVGNAQWAFKDFGTPLRPENPIPYVNQKGLVDRAGVPKDAYYVFKSYWTTSPKFCYVLSHTWLERNGPKGLQRPVRVYSNCEEVELVVNGVSLGKHRRDISDFPSAGLRWNVDFAEGKNAIRALGYEKGKVVTSDTLSIAYGYLAPGDAAEMHLKAERLNTGNYLLTAVAVDRDGRRALGYSKRVYFASEGEGRLLGDYGTPTGSKVIEMANGVARIEFEPARDGRAVIEARTHEFKGSFVIIPNQGE